jgi:hypothetical protein
MVASRIRFVFNLRWKVGSGSNIVLKSSVYHTLRWANDKSAAKLPEIFAMLDQDRELTRVKRLTMDLLECLSVCILFCMPRAPPLGCPR